MTERKKPVSELERRLEALGRPLSQEARRALDRHNAKVIIARYRASTTGPTLRDLDQTNTAIAFGTEAGTPLETAAIDEPADQTGKNEKASLIATRGLQKATALDETSDLSVHDSEA